MAAIAFVAHPQRARAPPAWPTGRPGGCGAQGHAADSSIADGARPATAQPTGPLDLAVSLGGDGTMLRTVDWSPGRASRSSGSTSAASAT